MKKTEQVVYLEQDVVAMMVPSGARIMLHEGTELRIVQALGDSFTVNVYGNLARIEGEHAKALGVELKDPLESLPEGLNAEQQIDFMLRQVYDPEIPVNVVDLGLIYNIDCQQNPDASYNVLITMTLTAPGCGMGPVIVDDVVRKVSALPTVASVDVDMVFDPPWDKSMMSEAAQLELGLF